MHFVQEIFIFFKFFSVYFDFFGIIRDAPVNRIGYGLHKIFSAMHAGIVKAHIFNKGFRRGKAKSFLQKNCRIPKDCPRVYFSADIIFNLTPHAFVRAFDVELPYHLRSKNRLVIKSVFLEVLPAVAPCRPAPAVHRGVKIRAVSRRFFYRVSPAGYVPDIFFVRIFFQCGVHKLKEIFSRNDVILQNDDLSVSVHDFRNAKNYGSGKPLVFFRLNDRHALAPRV